MPPQGESTGIAIEDGVLLAHVFQHHDTRNVKRIFEDYETLRRTTVDKLYDESARRWKHAAQEDSGWLWGIIFEWLTLVVMTLMNMRQADHFAADVEKLKLPW